ncbi:MAG: PQQ-dependent sugar dehydrogenase [Anaerolineales bacterium]|nr:PQQ-dependent sugar dehydrogenase [Anaerolineales bacterium]
MNPKRYLIFPALALIAALLLAAWQRPTAAADTAVPTGGPTVNLVDIFPQLSFSAPVDIASAGDNRLFVVEQAGRIRVVTLGTNPTTAPVFLDIDAAVISGGEMGLLGLAFDPHYASNGAFYVNYTHNSGQLVTRISRFYVTADPNVADPNSEEILLEIPQSNTPFNTNHNGGDLAFGPDGYLYVGMGDGGGSGDQDNNAQTMTTLLGKMLRIDVHGGGNPPDCDPNGRYTIPADNPYTGDPALCDEIWAAGVRNPWRFSFDRATGDLFIADVGQGNWEEVNVQPAGSPGGENYGWRCYEGNVPYNTAGCQPAGAYDFPVHVYAHGPHCSITGGFVYRGQQYPALQGHYVYGDYCSGQLWSLTNDGGGWTNTPLLDAGANLTTFGEDACGGLYAAVNGRLYHLQETSAAPAPNLCLSKSGPETAVYDQPVVYTLRLNNLGSAAASHVVVSDTLPSGATYVAGGSLIGDEVVWTAPSLPAAATATRQFTVTARADLRNDAYRLTADGGLAAQGETAVVTTILRPVLAISKTAPAAVLPGIPFTYTLTVHNSGAITATNLLITDALPAGATYVSGGTLANGEVSWQVGTLAPQTAVSVQFAVTTTTDLLNDAYGVLADAGFGAQGQQPVLTLVNARLAFLPLVIRP